MIHPYAGAVMRRSIGFSALLIAAALVLTACSPVIPIAYHVKDDVVDIAFCDAFAATSVEIDFSDHPPPGEGPMYSIAFRTASGPEANFGDGKPVSVSMEGWTFSSDSTAVPESWDRVDYSFLDDDNQYVGGELLFSRDVTSSDWTWQTGFGVTSPHCDLDLD